MLKKLTMFLLLASMVAVTPGMSAQDPPARPRCDDEMHRQFDFWVGSWNVTTPDGKEAGTNEIEKILNDCVLQESWVGKGGLTGHSYNVVGRGAGKWHQTWVDSSGALLLLDGGMKGKSMVLSGTRVSRKGGDVLDRITWTPISEDHVRQLWEQSSDGGKTWTVAFDGQYARRR